MGCLGFKWVSWEEKWSAQHLLTCFLSQFIKFFRYWEQTFSEFWIRNHFCKSFIFPEWVAPLPPVKALLSQLNVLFYLSDSLGYRLSLYFSPAYFTFSVSVVFSSLKPPFTFDYWWSHTFSFSFFFIFLQISFYITSCKLNAIFRIFNLFLMIVKTKKYNIPSLPS